MQSIKNQLGMIQIWHDPTESLLHPAARSEAQSLCSGRSEARGRGQRVVSFSFWGELETGYFRGIRDNLALMEELYPGWVMRLYVSSQRLGDEARRTLCDIQCNATISTV